MLLYQVFQFCQLEFVRRGKYGSHLNHCHRSREASKRIKWSRVAGFPAVKIGGCTRIVASDLIEWAKAQER